MRLQVNRFVDRIVNEFRQVDRAIAAGKDGDFSATKPKLEWVAFERAANALLERIAEEEKDAATKLIDFVSAAPDIDVDRIRPFELADQWGLDRRHLLGMCLHGVIAGLLELNWDIVCPSCRTVSTRLQSLEEIGEHGGCHLCDISFDLELDRAVEATFRPARALRELDDGPYCIGGPARTPHVFAQLIVPPDGRVELPGPEHAGRYRLFVRGGSKATVDVGPEGDEAAEVALTADSMTPAAISLKPGGAITVRQEAGSERHVKLERIEWGNQAATAHVVSTLADFRSMFAKDVLKPGITLSVAKVALLFTDLTDSTAMYSAMGDAKAFRVVQDHFEVLGGVVAEHDGVIVKTIGDAVMAAFTEESQAVQAAIEMHRAFRAWRKDHEHVQGTRLKVGIYAGACYAVTANGVLDYFGQSVNMAARLQGKAGAGELVLTEELANEADQRQWLSGAKVVERFDTTLKGVDQSVRIARVAVDTRSSTAPESMVSIKTG